MEGFFRGAGRFCSVLLGAVFFLGGLLKLMDPVGASLVMDGYLSFLHLGFLKALASFLADTAALFETILGAALITGVWRRITRIIAGAVLALFTILTLALWLGKAEMDCGCFGEIVHLTHVQSILKNLVLLALWAVTCLSFKNPGETPKVKYATFSVVVISVLLFTFYSMLSLPLVDFTSFKPGAELSTESVDEPGDATLSFYDMDWEYRDSLATQGKVMVVSVYDPDRMAAEDWGRAGSFLQQSLEAGYTPLLLSASAPSMVEETLSGVDAPTKAELLMQTYFSDRRTVITVNRSNGGATFLNDGQVVAKWTARSYPKADDLAAMSESDPEEVLAQQSGKGRLRVQGFLLYVFAVMLLI